MNSAGLGVIVFVCLFAAALAGRALRHRVPAEHLSDESKDVIKLATAVVGTLSALALGLLVATAKSALDGAGAELRNSAAHIVLLDRVLAHYGPETKEARETLRKVMETHLSTNWDTGALVSNGNSPDDDTGIEPVQDLLRGLTPETDAQRWLLTRALDVSGQIAEAHWLLVEVGDESLPRPFFVIMVSWLSVLFATFGLLSPRNPTVLLVLVVCALSVAGAVFLITDMANPFRGVIYISEQPLRDALAQLGRS